MFSSDTHILHLPQDTRAVLYSILTVFFTGSFPPQQNPDPRRMQINLTGFLNGKSARLFMSELWTLLVSAQESSAGIPEVFMAQKKEEIKKRMVRL